MKSLEKLIGNKILDLVNDSLVKIIKPDITIDRVTQLDGKEIEKIKQKYGIDGMILDVDNTLRKEMRNIPQCNQEWIESLRGRIKIVILSNGIDGDIEKYFKEIGIDYISFAHKPLKKNFMKACEKMQLNPDRVLVVGDSLIGDIYGGRRNNMKTVLVKEVDEGER